MKAKEIRFDYEMGMNIEAIGAFVFEASRFQAAIRIVYEEKAVDAKSILGLCSLAVPPGTLVLLEAEGEDEEAAVAHLLQFLKQEP